MKIDIVVNSPKGEYVFSLLGHRVNSKEKLMLPVEGFYDGREAFDSFFPHWEIEVIAPVKKREEIGKLNYHFSKINGLHYVCYPNRLADAQAIMEVISRWAVGQVCVIELDRWLNEILNSLPTGETLIDWARINYNINIENIFMTAA